MPRTEDSITSSQSSAEALVEARFRTASWRCLTMRLWERHSPQLMWLMMWLVPVWTVEPAASDAVPGLGPGLGSSSMTEKEGTLNVKPQ